MLSGAYVKQVRDRPGDKPNSGNNASVDLVRTHDIARSSKAFARGGKFSCGEVARA
jgi:hypothetical protein